MKYTIAGFDQAALVDAGLGIVDTEILRWFVDFQGTGRMREVVRQDGTRFFMVSYKAVMDDLPILDIRTTKGIYVRFQKLVEKGFLEHFHFTEKGSFSTYRVTEKVGDLTGTPRNKTSDPLGTELPTPRNKTSDPLGTELPTPRNKTSDPLGTKLPSKYSSTRILSNQTPISPTFGFSTPESIPRDLWPEAVLSYLNLKTSSRFRKVKGTGIAERISEGHSLTDFMAVIDCKASEWTGTKMEQYLAPDTLFSPSKFEKYLNQARRESVGVSKAPGDDWRLNDPLAQQLQGASL